MANPEVMKRLEEIERLTDPASPDDTPFDDEVRWLLKLTRALLESQPNPGQTHYQGDDCPGGHASVCGYCGEPCDACERAGTPPGEPVLKLGHGFVSSSGIPEVCQYPFCGQPREAH